MWRAAMAVVLVCCAFRTAAQNVCIAPASVPFLAAGTTFTSQDNQQVSYENVVDAWLVSGSPLRTVTCPDGTNQCLVVPVLSSSTSCSVDYGRCNATPGSATERCVATDEMSQFGIALAMARGSTYAARFAEWFNTLSAMRPLGKYGLPPWIVRVVWTGGTTTIATKDATNGNLNDAIDGTARVALALYIAADNPTFPDGDRMRYLRAANDLATAMLERDFVDRSLTVRGRTVNKWLTGGWFIAETNGNVSCGEPPERKNNCGTVGFAGYYGDVMIALLSAYAHTGDVKFHDAAGDTLQNYLYASRFDGSAFRVPPTEFAWWDTPPLGGDFEALCKDTCGASACNDEGEGQWDSFDAPRAVSLCKAGYFWSRLGTVDPDLKTYCEAWVNTPSAITATTYQKVYSWDGNVCPTSDPSFYDNGLGAYMNFYCASSQLDDRLAAIFATYVRAANAFQNTSCMGVYMQTFPVISFGSATGRDVDALSFRPLSLAATAGASNVQLAWSAVTNAAHYEVWRRNGAGPWQLLAPNVVPAGYTDAAVAAGNAYLYRVRAVLGDGSPTPFSNLDLATMFAFTDDPLVASQTPIRAAHITELRTAIDALRSTAGMAAATYTRGTLTPQQTIVSAIDVTELRASLAATLTSLGLALPTSTNPTLVAQVTPVRAVDITELRTALR